MRDCIIESFNHGRFTESGSAINAGSILFLATIHKLIGSYLLHHIKLTVSPGVFEHIFAKFYFCEARDAGGDICPLVREPEEICLRFAETLKFGCGQVLHSSKLIYNETVRLACQDKKNTNFVLINSMIDRVIDCPIDWLIDGLID